MKGAIEMELLQQQEVCKILRCCRNTYYRMLKTTDMPRVRVGRNIYVPREALLEWLQAQYK